MKYYLQTIPASLSNNLLLKLSASLFFLFAPFSAAILTLLALTVIDFITGMYRSTKTVFITEKPKYFKNKLKLFWTNIQSRKLRYSAEKIATYGIVIFVFAIFTEFVFPVVIAGYSLTNIIIGLLCIIELKSITENLSSISNNPVFKKLFSLFEKKVKEQTGIDTTVYTTLEEEKK